MFKVVIRFHATGGKVRAIFNAPSLGRASAEYAKLRDASGEGGSTWPGAVVYGQGTETDSPVAFISYNGKVWRDDPCARDWDWRNPPSPLFNPFTEA